MEEDKTDVTGTIARREESENPEASNGEPGDTSTSDAAAPPTDESVIGPVKSKNARKREERFAKRAELMKILRPLEKAKRKQKKLASRQQKQASATDENPYISRRVERKILKAKLATALLHGVKLIVDMSFADLMSPKEIGQLASQINYMYSSNKAVEHPFCMHICSLVEGTLLHEEVVKRCPGFENYKIKVFQEPLETLFPKEELVYLSPDSPNVLNEVDPSKIYIIGGLVDGTPKREVSLTRAAAIGCQTARLPITEHMTRITPHGYNTILTLNQVYEILMRFHQTKSWDSALKHCVPQRKGFVVHGDVQAEPEGEKTEKNASSSEISAMGANEIPSTTQSGKDFNSEI